ncbi:MAG: alpha/beta fold hydrolase [Ktedonobacteraceae bacterium]
MKHPIVFIHGSGDSRRIWRLQLEQLGEVYALYAVDLPGHGQRPDTLPMEATVQDYTEAVYEIMRNELQLNAPIIAGHSLGGAIALSLALEHGSALGGLILIGTGARLRVLESSLEAARTAPQEARTQLVRMGFTRDAAATLPQAVISEQVTPPSNTLYRDLAACNIFDCMARLHEISLPTLIICGADDSATPVKYSQYLHDHIAGSTLRIIPDAGHYVFREQPEAVNQAMEEWLQQL